MKKAPKGTTRGVFVVSKTGRIEAVEPGVSNEPLGVTAEGKFTDHFSAGSCGHSGSCPEVG